MTLPMVLLAALLFNPPIVQPPPPVETVGLCAGAGLLPESLVVAGLGQLQGTAVLAAAPGAADQVYAVLAAEAAVDGAGATLTQSEEALLFAPGTQELVAARDAAKTALSAAVAGLDTARSELRSALLAGFPGSVASTVATYAASATRSVPPEFRVLAKSPEEWSLVEAAVRGEARASRVGQPQDQAQAALLAGIRSSPPVAAAKAALAANLAGMDHAFFGGPG